MLKICNTYPNLRLYIWRKFRPCIVCVFFVIFMSKTSVCAALCLNSNLVGSKSTPMHVLTDKVKGTYTPLLALHIDILCIIITQARLFTYRSSRCYWGAVINKQIEAYSPCFFSGACHSSRLQFGVPYRCDPRDVPFWQVTISSINGYLPLEMNPGCCTYHWVPTKKTWLSLE